MAQTDNFYTLKGYSLLEHTQITSSMEDYLEMICRIHRDGQPVRIKELAECLHVKPSSASKMVGNLRKQGLVCFEKYGTVSLTEDGLELGEYLLFRHEVLHRFFCYINQNSDELEQVEKVEHFIEPKTVYNIEKWLDKFT
ncbi:MULTISPECIES: metal-dependent transcriptional regulator [Lacrimispora]|jgi:Mn-dependent DtxR family transcriptional regulator|uniref:Iron (Metal) dependent repressor, DtxR family n=1 Tax=Lacrimispora sphenoides JCM 1415 TaxID=1297793 RepID=A0ABY1CCB0_9FIRM|nr:MULTISPECIES: metal-dependent transcriptional regulator [Lacrimispora]EXG88447.1 iron (metal) dependent repressor, DtxR family [Clostridium sp. ASBs410]SET92056.1 iron (metal) dependent repressor, DtxR family [[Clostridium] sphenoides JCM 1415]MDR7811494.1 metal-dependent transcriptional regulator [Lacrimispora sp.]SET98279.1 iron (metal) dependent repressor, DtxR family [Lacrimispora sphenoides]SUY52360.1 iron dependent repressor [Lacrimispora sphenoides]